jgi:hypothetical protein
MFEVKSRSPEAWGPLAKCSDDVFNFTINGRTGNTKDLIKQNLAFQKKLKKYKIQFIKEWRSDMFEIEAVGDYEVGSKALEYFKNNADKIGFHELPRDESYKGYDKFTCLKVK